MKLKKLLVSASAAACLVWPAAVLADPPSDHGGKPDEQGQQHGGQPATHGGGPPGAHVGPTGPVGAPTVHAAPQMHGTPVGPVNPRPDMTVHRPPVAGPTAPAPSVQIGPAGRRGGRVVRPPAGLPRLGDWNRTVRGPDRDQAGQQWRQGHSNWDNRSPWRQNPDWWRRDRSFRLFLGPRIGFFFIPDFGYVRAPQEYEKHYWRTGEFLPNWFWRYEVREYWRYNLPQPPDGCIWVWVDNDIALIDASDGYILDIVHNAW